MGSHQNRQGWVGDRLINLCGTGAVCEQAGNGRSARCLGQPLYGRTVGLITLELEHFLARLDIEELDNGVAIGDYDLAHVRPTYAHACGCR